MNLSDIKSGLINASASINRRLKDVKSNGEDRSSLVLNKIAELAPLIDLIGFNMKELILQAGIPAGATVIFVKEKDVDVDTIDAILKENENKEMLGLIVRALQKADALQRKMQLCNYNFTKFYLKLGVPPEVSLRFSRVPDWDII
jgi:hypothetical protein